jgi:hypothetical protein
MNIDYDWYIKKTDNDRKYISTLKRFDKPVGLKTIAYASGIAQDTIESIIEPFLLEREVILKTEKGRVWYFRPAQLAFPGAEGFGRFARGGRGGKVVYVNNLNDMIDSSNSITRRTFLKYIDRKELQEIESQLGYSNHPKKGLTMASDWSVTYHKSKLKNKFSNNILFSSENFSNLLKKSQVFSEDEQVRKLALENTIVTGGSIASMLLNEKVNDFDIYFGNSYHHDADRASFFIIRK